MPSQKAVTTPSQRFNPRELFAAAGNQSVILQANSLGPDWNPLFEHECDFDSEGFFKVLHYLVRNPNINSSLLFRADILYDSDKTENVDVTYGDEDIEKDRPDLPSSLPGFRLQRTIVRKFVPRNDALDRPVNQTVLYYTSTDKTQNATSLMLLYPHVSSPDRMPFYHPAVKAIAYIHNHGTSLTPTNLISIHYLPFPSPTPPQPLLPFTDRQLRTARNLLGTLYKHGQGGLRGYQKRVHHDQIIEQKRVQDRFAELKRRHAHRLISSWVEVTDPKKQVFEQIAIAAFLVEVWREMYALPEGAEQGKMVDSGVAGTEGRAEQIVAEALNGERKPPFPGFVDVGCGNGVLVELLLCEGYRGWGIEGHRRRTWQALKPETQAVLVHGIVVPAPLDFIASPETSIATVLREATEGVPGPARSTPDLNGDSPTHLSSSSRFLPIRAIKSWLSKSSDPSSPYPASLATVASSPATHNGLFPSLLPHLNSSNSSSADREGQFLISNHADELTAWTPLLASLTKSAFFILPCCSRNLSGERFRAPSYANGYVADSGAPGFFAGRNAAEGRGRPKHVAIPMPTEGNERRDEEAEDQESVPPSPTASSISPLPSDEVNKTRSKTYNFLNAPSPSPSVTQLPPMIPSITANFSSEPTSTAQNMVSGHRPAQAAETGDLKALSQKARSKQPSAYQSLCSWVVHLADQCGYLVEREYLRVPSTRNYGILGRFVKGSEGEGGVVALAGGGEEVGFEERMQKVLRIVEGQGHASRERWGNVCEREVIKGKDLDHI